MRGVFFVALLRQHLRSQKTRCSPCPFSLSLLSHTDTTIGHASRSLCNATPYAFIRAYPHDKHRTVIDICPYRSKSSGIIRPSNNVVGGAYRDHRKQCRFSRSQLRLSLSRIYGTQDTHLRSSLLR